MVKRNLAGALITALFLMVGLGAGGVGAEVPVPVAADVQADTAGVGAAFVYLGSDFGPSRSPEWKVEGDRKEAQFGFSVSTAGDVNGDGYDDVIVGAPGYAEGQELDSRGAAYVYYGSEDGLSRQPNWWYVSEQAQTSLGWSVSTAGDVNNDGFADVVVGAPWYNGVVDDVGAVLLFYGSASGLSSTYDQILLGDQEGARFGAAVAGGGNVDGDVGEDGHGYDDVVIGAPDYDSDEEDPDLNGGAAFIYYGSEKDGLVDSTTLTAGSMPVGAQFGISVAVVGNVDGDDYADVVVGAPGWANPNDYQRYEGGVFLFLGKPVRTAPIGPAWIGEGDKADAGLGWSVGSAGDVNHDHRDDIIVGAPYIKHSDAQVGAAFVYWQVEGVLPSLPNREFYGANAGDELGYAVGTGGDVDGDGDGDFVVGARRGESSADPVENEGSISSLYGDTSPTWVVGSGQAGSLFGQSVATAGDVNGDDKADIIVGAPGYKPSSTVWIMLPLVLNGTG